MPHTELSHGTLHYEESGAGAPVVFLHGYLMGARLWDPVVRLLEDEFRCLVPELPFGAHPAPMNPGADLTSARAAAFAKPALLAWAADDRWFPVEHAQRLAAVLPGAQLEVIADSRTWVMRDQPERTAHLIAGLARRAAARQAA